VIAEVLLSWVGGARVGERQDLAEPLPSRDVDGAGFRWRFGQAVSPATSCAVVDGEERRRSRCWRPRPERVSEPAPVLAIVRAGGRLADGAAQRELPASLSMTTPALFEPAMVMAPATVLLSWLFFRLGAVGLNPFWSVMASPAAMETLFWKARVAPTWTDVDHGGGAEGGVVGGDDGAAGDVGEAGVGVGAGEDEGAGARFRDFWRWWPR